MAGRPTYLTAKRKSLILGLVAKGRSPSAAAEMVGISVQTMSDWRRRGQEGGVKNKIYVDFVRDLNEALEKFEATHLARIAGGPNGEVVIRKKHIVRERGQVVREEVWEETRPQAWTASAWLLQKIYPERYSDKHMVQHSGTVTSEAKIKPFSAWSSEEGIEVPDNVIIEGTAIEHDGE